MEDGRIHFLPLLHTQPALEVGESGGGKNGTCNWQQFRPRGKKLLSLGSRQFAVVSRSRDLNLVARMLRTIWHKYLSLQGITKETFPDLVSLLTFVCPHPANLMQSGKHNHQIFTKPGKVSLVIPCIIELPYGLNNNFDFR